MVAAAEQFMARMEDNCVQFGLKKCPPALLRLKMAENGAAARIQHPRWGKKNVANMGLHFSSSLEASDKGERG